MKKWKASYTVEASVIVPLVLWVLAVVMQLGIAMHEEIEGQTEQEAVADLWEVDEFYICQTVGEIVDDQS